MRRFLLFTVLGFIGAGAVWVGIVFHGLGSGTPGSRWIEEIYSIKDKRAREIKGPKVVIVGGSSVLCGFSARFLTQATAVEFVNYGSHIGLGPLYMLERVKRILRPGDLLLLSFEYEFYVLPKVLATDVLLDYIIVYDPVYFAGLPISEKLLYPLRIPALSVIRALRAKAQGGRHLTVEDVSGHRGYSSDTVNQYGDETANARAAIDAVVIKQREESYNRLVVGSRVNPELARALVEFAKWCHAHRVRVCMTWPNTVRWTGYNSDQGRKMFDAISRASTNAGIPVLGNPQDAMYDADSLYDTFYHLNDAAQLSHSRDILRLIAPYLDSLLSERHKLVKENRPSGLDCRSKTGGDRKAVSQSRSVDDVDYGALDR